MAKKKQLVKIGKRRVELTDKEAEIVAVLRRSRRSIGPTEIGNSCGKTHDAAAWAAPVLKKLVDRGIVERLATVRGQYQLAR